MDTQDDEQPVHVVFDCSTGERTDTPLDAAELAAHHAAVAAEDARRTQEAAEDDALRAAVAAHPDPIVQALAKRLGLA